MFNGVFVVFVIKIVSCVVYKNICKVDNDIIIICLFNVSKDFLRKEKVKRC